MTFPSSETLALLTDYYCLRVRSAMPSRKRHRPKKASWLIRRLDDAKVRYESESVTLVQSEEYTYKKMCDIMNRKHDDKKDTARIRREKAGHT